MSSVYWRQVITMRVAERWVAGNLSRRLWPLVSGQKPLRSRYDRVYPVPE